MKDRFFIFILILFNLACQPSVRYSTRNETTVKQEYGDRSLTDKLKEFVRDWLHIPYHYGGNDKNGIDCSGLVVQFMQYAYGIKVPRQAQDQYTQGRKISRSRLQPGNLVFFSDLRGRDITHVGIYLGENKFVHATDNEGVTISSLDDEFYTAKFAGACRYR
jgi:lipoprotein Spr